MWLLGPEGLVPKSYGFLGGLLRQGRFGSMCTYQLVSKVGLAGWGVFFSEADLIMTYIISTGSG